MSAHHSSAPDGDGEQQTGGMLAKLVLFALSRKTLNGTNRSRGMSRLPRTLRARIPSSRPIPPVDRIQSRRQCRANQQVIMPPAGRHAPAQQLPRFGEDLVGAGGQLVTIDPRDVGAVVGVLLDPPPSIKPTTAQPRSDFVFLFMGKGENITCRRPSAPSARPTA